MAEPLSTTTAEAAANLGAAAGPVVEPAANLAEQAMAAGVSVPGQGIETIAEAEMPAGIAAGADSVPVGEVSGGEATESMAPKDAADAAIRPDETGADAEEGTTDTASDVDNSAGQAPATGETATNARADGQPTDESGADGVHLDEGTGVQSTTPSESSNPPTDSSQATETANPNGTPAETSTAATTDGQPPKEPQPGTASAGESPSSEPIPAKDTVVNGESAAANGEAAPGQQGEVEFTQENLYTQQAIAAKDADITTQIKDLEGKKTEREKAGAHLNAEEQSRLDAYKSEQRFRELDKKNNDINQDLTPSEQDQYDKLATERERRRNAVPENQMTDQQKTEAQLERTGIKILTGEMPMEQGMAAMQALGEKRLGLPQTMSRTEALKAIKTVMDRLTAKRGSETHNAVRDKLNELLAQELQLMQLPATLDRLRNRAEQLRKRIQAEEKSHGQNPSNIKDRVRIIGLKGQLNTIIQSAATVRNFYPDLIARYRDNMQWVNRKLGITRGFQALLDWTGAKLQNAEAYWQGQMAAHAEYSSNAFSKG